MKGMMRMVKDDEDDNEDGENDMRVGEIGDG